MAGCGSVTSCQQVSLDEKGYRIKDRPRPNLEHMILHALVLTGLVLAVVTATAA
jgi:hypothetical protein